MIFRLDLFINDSNKSLPICKLLDICANVEITLKLNLYNLLTNKKYLQKYLTVEINICYIYNSARCPI